MDSDDKSTHDVDDGVQRGFGVSPMRSPSKLMSPRRKQIRPPKSRTESKSVDYKQHFPTATLLSREGYGQ